VFDCPQCGQAITPTDWVDRDYDTAENTPDSLVASIRDNEASTEEEWREFQHGARMHRPKRAPHSPGRQYINLVNNHPWDRLTEQTRARLDPTQDADQQHKRRHLTYTNLSKQESPHHGVRDHADNRFHHESPRRTTGTREPNHFDLSSPQLEGPHSQAKPTQIDLMSPNQDRQRVKALARDHESRRTRVTHINLSGPQLEIPHTQARPTQLNLVSTNQDGRGEKARARGQPDQTRYHRCPVCNGVFSADIIEMHCESHFQ